MGLRSKFSKLAEIVPYTTESDPTGLQSPVPLMKTRSALDNLFSTEELMALKPQAQTLNNSQGMNVLETPDVQMDPEVVEAAQNANAEIPALRAPASENKPIMLAQNEAVESTGSSPNYSDALDLIRAGQFIGSGLGGMGTGQVLKPDTSLVDALQSNIRNKQKDALEKSQVESRLGLQALEKSSKEEELKTKQALKDPNSEVSQRYRDQVLSLFPNYKDVPGFSTASAAQLDDTFKFLNLKEQIDSRKETAAAGKEERALKAKELAKQTETESERKANQFITNRTANFQTTVNNDLEKLDEQIAKGANIDEVAELAKTNPISSAQLGVQVAKAMGEVGALSESDVTRYIANPALANRATQYLTKLATGTIPDENAELVKEAMGALTRMAKDRRNVILRKRAKQYARNVTTNLKRPTSINDTLALLGEDQAIDLNDEMLNAPQTLELSKAQVASNKQEDTSNEVERLDKTTNKIAIFDAKTKKFKRWK